MWLARKLQILLFKTQLTCRSPSNFNNRSNLERDTMPETPGVFQWSVKLHFFTCEYVKKFVRELFLNITLDYD